MRVGIETGRPLPANKVIGESWELVDRAGEQSVIAEGEYAGTTLRELLERSASEILGPGADGSKPFPPGQWLDCRTA